MRVRRKRLVTAALFAVVLTFASCGSLKGFLCDRSNSITQSVQNFAGTLGPIGSVLSVVVSATLDLVCAAGTVVDDTVTTCGAIVGVCDPVGGAPPPER